MTRNRREPRSGLSASRSPKYTTKQLSLKTWRDFERLFMCHPAPGAHPCWCMYNHRRGSSPARKDISRAAEIEQNRREKRALVEQGRSRGILVYTQAEPIGWCQYGLSEELPRIDDHPKYRQLSPEAGAERLWRIGCFVVHNKHRRSGVASVALKAALSAIRREGGGVVEAYPIKRWDAYAKFRGTLSMFEREGFEIVGPFGENNVLVRRTV